MRRLLKQQSRVLCGPMRALQLDKAGLSQAIGVFEIHIQRALEGVVKEGSVVYDVGAANGFFTLLCCRLVGSAGHVFAFEPLPENAATVRGVLEANRFDNWTVVPRAAGSSCGTAHLYVGARSERNTTSSLLESGGECLDVTVISLDEFVGEGNRKPTVVKMDIEGAEALALQGASHLLSSPKSPTWIIEVHSEPVDRCVRDILSSNGYEVRLIPSPRPKIYPCHILATK